MNSEDIKKIFQPLVTDIQRLVEEQINLVKVKRLSEQHAKASEIKVSLSRPRIRGLAGADMLVRLFF